MSVRMRHTRSHTRNRRSHHALSRPSLSTCAHCGEKHISHQVCTHCGFYRGRHVIDVAAERARTERKMKKKAKERGVEASTSDDKERAAEKTGPLSAEELSKK